MAYTDIAQLHSDNDFIFRTQACVATEGELEPEQWVSEHIWEMAAAPGFGDAYAYAVASENPRPGNDPAVITDGMILGAVQAIRNAAP
jgi:hypothetical protein